MAGGRKPSWFVDLTLTKPSGQFRVTSSYRERHIQKPSGQFNKGAFQERTDLFKPTKDFKVTAGYEKPNVAKPRTAGGKSYLHGKYTEPQEGGDPDPWGNYVFSFMLDETEIAQFLECSGLKTAAQVFEIEEGGMNWNTHKRPGISKWENIVLKRAVHKSDAFIEWRDYYLQPPGEKGWERRANTSAAIIVYTNKGEKLRTFNTLQPWPVSWEGPSLSGGGSELSVETLEIAHSGILLYTPEPKPEPTPEPLPDKIETPPVLFDYDKPKDPVKAGDGLKDPEGKDAVDEAAEQLNEHPEIVNVWIDAHTCDLGSRSYNLALSNRRATSVKLDMQKKAPDKKYWSKGYGYNFPKVPNDSEANRAQNRRVDFWQTERPSDDQGIAPRPGESRYTRKKKAKR
jgi:phage tail-like protein